MKRPIKFYVITTATGASGGSGRRFGTRKEAQEEAERLLRKHKTGYPDGLVVLEAIDHVRLNPEPEVAIDEITCVERTSVGFTDGDIVLYPAPSTTHCYKALLVTRFGTEPGYDTHGFYAKKRYYSGLCECWKWHQEEAFYSTERAVPYDPKLIASEVLAGCPERRSRK